MAIKYSNYANTINQVNKIIEGKLKLHDENCNICHEEVQKYVENIDKSVIQAILDRRLDDLLKFYNKSFQIYNSILISQPEQLEAAASNLATFFLITKNVKQFINLKLKFRVELNQDLIKNLGLDVNQIINIEKRISAQIPMSLKQTMHNQDTIEDNISDQVLAIGDDNHSNG